MTYTSHGHHIPGTVRPVGRPPSKHRCGGVGMCVTCTQEAIKENPALTFGQEAPSLEASTDKTESASPMFKAKQLVLNQANNQWSDVKDLELSDIFIVWFSKTLQNWKALVGTTRDDGMYYEVTYNGDKKETYVDAYKKWSNTAYPDQDDS